MNKYPHVLKAVTAAIVILFFWLVTLYLGFNLEFNNRGTFGDMFGSINALYSGMALAGIIFTIFLQMDDLKLTRKELKDTRKEFIKQNKTLEIQKFENQLFNLINLNQNIVKELIFTKDKDTIITGRNVFKSIYENKSDKDGKIVFNEEDDLGHYFNNIYRILKFITRESSLQTVDQYKYSNYIRDLLSTYELICILYWCIEQKENDSLFENINEYSLFKNIPEKFKDVSLHKNLTSQAFKPLRPDS